MLSGGVFILHKLFAVSVYLKSKESCIQKGFVGRNTFILGPMTSVLSLGFYLWSEVWSLMITMYFVLIFQCLHLIPGKSMLVKSLAFLCTHVNLSNTTFIKLDWWCFTQQINLVFLEK